MYIGLVALSVAFAQPVQVDGQVETTVLGAERTTTCITVDVDPATLECQHVQTVVTREIMRSPTYRSPAMRQPGIQMRGIPAPAGVSPPVERSQWSERIQRTQAKNAQSAQQVRQALPVAPLQRSRAEPIPAAVPAGFIQPVVPGVVGFGVTPVGLVSPEDITPMGALARPTR